jgi:TolB-like protein
MRNLGILILLLQLGACSQLCDCKSAKTSDINQVEAEESNTTSASSGQTIADEMQAETMPVDQSSQVASSGEEVVNSRPMQEAPPVSSVSEPSQFDQLLAEKEPKPIFQLAASRLQRRVLPSESDQMGMANQQISPYPQLLHSRKELLDYAAQAAFKLAAFDSLRGAKVGVASFVEFDPTLRQSTAVGNQFAEAMVSLLPQYGVDVIEYKLTRGITVGPSGDFALSRDIKSLQANVGMDYILTGTVVATKRGLQIHSRVVSVGQHKVIAATSTLIPHLVLQQIQP